MGNKPKRSHPHSIPDDSRAGRVSLGAEVIDANFRRRARTCRSIAELQQLYKDAERIEGAAKLSTSTHRFALLSMKAILLERPDARGAASALLPSIIRSAIASLDSPFGQSGAAFSMPAFVQALGSLLKSCRIEVGAAEARALVASIKPFVHQMSLVSLSILAASLDQMNHRSAEVASCLDAIAAQASSHLRTLNTSASPLPHHAAASALAVVASDDALQRESLSETHGDELDDAQRVVSNSSTADRGSDLASGGGGALDSAAVFGDARSVWYALLGTAGCGAAWVVWNALLADRALLRTAQASAPHLELHEGTDAAAACLMLARTAGPELQGGALPLSDDESVEVINQEERHNNSIGWDGSAEGESADESGSEDWSVLVINDDELAAAMSARGASEDGDALLSEDAWDSSREGPAGVEEDEEGKVGTSGRADTPPSRELSMLLFAYSGLGFRSAAVHNLLEAAAARAVEVLSHGNARDLSMFLGTFARLGYRSPAVTGMLEGLAAGSAARLLYKGDIGCLSNVLWACAKLEVPLTPQMEQFLDWMHVTVSCRLDVQRTEPRVLGSVLWSFAALRRQGYQNDGVEPFVDSLARSLCSTLASAGHHEITNILWAYASLRVHKSGAKLLFLAAPKHICASISSFSCQELSNIVWAYATLAIHHAPMMDAIAQQLQTRHAQAASTCTMQTWANVCWAFGHLNHRSPALEAALHSWLADVMTKKVRVFPQEDFCSQLLAGMAVLEIIQPPEFEWLASQLQQLATSRRAPLSRTTLFHLSLAYLSLESGGKHPRGDLSPHYDTQVDDSASRSTGVGSAAADSVDALPSQGPRTQPFPGLPFALAVNYRPPLHLRKTINEALLVAHETSEMAARQHSQTYKALSKCLRDIGIVTYGPRSFNSMWVKMMARLPHGGEVVVVLHRMSIDLTRSHPPNPLGYAAWRVRHLERRGATVVQINGLHFAKLSLSESDVHGWLRHAFAADSSHAAESDGDDDAS